ncbi:MAG: hypothetical protein MK132_27390, partial [Lentisphaerales bacterium]|nr:hypothetical protein [Lentisphaerales bacterium]
IAVVAIMVYFIPNKNLSETSIKSINIESEVTPQSSSAKRHSIKSVHSKEELIANYSRITPKNNIDAIEEDEEYVNTTHELYDKTFEKALNQGYGQTPEVAENNPQVDSVKEALINGGYPERLSPLIRPTAFDSNAYSNDESYRKKYLATAEYGRVFQSVNPGKSIPKTERISPYYQQVAQGETINLTLKSAPKMPVTFTSFDLGKFSNGLTTQTVEADESGHAQVTFHGMPGTIANVNILASSPAASGQVKFLVYTKFNEEGK